MTSRASASAPAFVSPFARLNDLLEGIAPGAAAINLTVGEPRHGVPAIVAPVLASAIADFGRYPPIKGTDAFRAAVAAWLERRYGLDGAIDPATMILPLNGSREGLFYAAIEARMSSGKAAADPVVLLPNPFYQAYAAGCTAAARCHSASESLQAGTICMVAHSSIPITSVTQTATTLRTRCQASNLATGQARAPKASSA